MPFIVHAQDYADALPRRMENRAAHLDRLKSSGKGLYAAALLNDKGDMFGSMLVLDFATRAEIDAFLADEPYITGKVWDKITVTPCKPAVLAP
jgi:hypothetical protein